MSNNVELLVTKPIAEWNVPDPISALNRFLIQCNNGRFLWFCHDSSLRVNQEIILQKQTIYETYNDQVK